MTGRERILSVIKGEIPDRVPVGIFVQEEFLAYFFPDKQKVDRTKDAVECAQILGFDVITRGREFEFPYFLRKSYTNWQVDINYKNDGSNLYEITEITTPKGCLKQVKVGPYDEKIRSGVHLSTIEYFIKGEKDFEIFRRYIPDIDAESIKHMREVSSNAKKTVGETGITAPWGWTGVFNQAATIRNIEDLLLDSYEDDGFYDAYMSEMTGLITKYNGILAECEYDCIGIQGNIANSALVGKDFFERLILPYEKQVIDVIKGTGKYTLYHNCGNAKVLQQCYVKMGIDIWETVAEPPRGDNSLAESKREIGDKLTLLGNLDQVDFLKKATCKEIEEEVTRIMNTGKPGGRYIFGTADYLETDTPIENVKKVIETAIREGKY